jgi:hypothetical protein
MKSLIKLTCILFTAFTLFSFTSFPDNQFVGKYGVSKASPTTLELVLNEDYTFAYKDYSNAKKPIDVKGNWEVKNNHVVLTNYNSDNSFHTKWKIKGECMIAKSRKGLCFYSLGRID